MDRREPQQEGGPAARLPAELQRYAALLGFPGSEELLGILALLYADEDQRRVAAALPGTVAGLVSQTGLKRTRVQRATDRLRLRGALAFSLAQPLIYRLPPRLADLRDATVVAPDAPPELLERWERLLLREMPALVARLKRQRAPATIRVLPAEAALAGAAAVSPTQSAAGLLREAELIVALPCACRTQAWHNGRGAGCPAPDPGLCIQTDRHALSTLGRGVGRRLDRAEALRRLGLAERAGLVHTVSHNPRSGMYLCNCCPCCCEAIRMATALDFPGSLAPASFRAVVRQQDCTACGACRDRCPFGAVALEQTARVDPGRCLGCGLCVLDCPEQALSLAPQAGPGGGRRRRSGAQHG